MSQLRPSYINTQLQPISVPLRPVDSQNEYAQIADLVAKGLGLTANAINASANLQNANTQMLEADNAKKAAEAVFIQSEKDAKDNLTIAGYKFDTEKDRMLASSQEQDMPKMLAEAGGSYTKVLENNPGLLRPVREKVQSIIAKNKAEQDIAQFQAMVILQPKKEVSKIAEEFINLKSKSDNGFDSVTQGFYLSSLQEAINKDIALNTVQNAETQRLSAVDANDSIMQDQLTGLYQAGALDANTFNAVVDTYVNSQSNIDNRRSETVLRSVAYSSLKSVLTDASKLNAKRAQETFDKIFPKDAQGRNTIPAISNIDYALATALKTEIDARIVSESNTKMSNLKNAIDSDSSHYNLLQQYVNTQGSDSFTDNEKVGAAYEIGQVARTKLDSELDLVQTREALKVASDRAQAYLDSGMFTREQFLDYKVKEQNKAAELKSKFDVQDVISRVQGWQNIILDSKADQYINLHVNSKMNPITLPDGKVLPGMSLDKAYTYMIETFGKLTPEFISGLDDLANSPGIPSGDPNADFRQNYQRISDAVSVFVELKKTAPGYVNQLLSEKKLSPKLQAIYGAVDILGEKPDNVALSLMSVPKEAFVQAESNYSTPPKGMSGSISAIRDSFGAGSGFISGLFTSAPDAEGISSAIVNDYKNLYLYNYGLLWARSQGGMSANEISIAASKSAANALKNTNVSIVQNFGNFKSVVSKRQLPPNFDNNTVSRMADIWDAILIKVEGAGSNFDTGFENIRYGTTNLNIDKFGVSDDGKYYEWDVYQTDKPNGKLSPIAKFRLPVDEIEMKKVLDDIKTINNRSSNISSSGDETLDAERAAYFRQKENESFIKELFVPYKVNP